ncbi:MAG: hypothetical protein ACMXYF_04410 [Candidatus Woesearchaeota archaeon]
MKTIKEYAKNGMKDLYNRPHHVLLVFILVVAMLSFFFFFQGLITNASDTGMLDVALIIIGTRVQEVTQQAGDPVFVQQNPNMSPIDVLFSDPLIRSAFYRIVFAFSFLLLLVYTCAVTFQYAIFRLLQRKVHSWRAYATLLAKWVALFAVCRFFLLLISLFFVATQQTVFGFDILHLTTIFDIVFLFFVLNSIRRHSFKRAFTKPAPFIYIYVGVFAAFFLLYQLSLFYTPLLGLFGHVISAILLFFLYVVMLYDW